MLGLYMWYLLLCMYLSMLFIFGCSRLFYVCMVSLCVFWFRWLKLMLVMCEVVFGKYRLIMLLLRLMILNNCVLW